MPLLRTIARSQEQLVAIYISTSTLGVAVVTDRSGLPKVSAYDFAHLDPESIAVGEHSWLEQPELAADALRKLLKSNGIRRKDASISIPTHDVILRKAEIPLMSETEFLSAAELGGLWDAFSWMPSSPDEYFVDFTSFNRDRERGMMTACMVAAPLAVVNKYSEIVRLAGLRTVMIDTHNFAIWRALNRWVGNEQDGETAICEIVRDRDYVTVLRDGIPELTELYGMEQLRQQLIADVEMSEADQQQLFDSYASQIASVLQKPRFNLDGTPAETSEQSAATVLMLSDIPAIARQREVLEQSLSQQGLQLGELEQIFSRPEPVATKLDQEHNQAALLVTLGLGLRRIELFHSSSQTLWGARVINLLPGYRQLKRVRKTRFLLNFWSALIGLPLVAAMLFIQFTQSQEHLRLSTEMVDYQRLTRSVSHLNQQLSERGVELNRLNRLLKVADGVGNNYALTYQLLTHLVTHIPLDVRLDRIDWQQSGILQLKGVASSDDEILRLVDDLRGDPLFHRVSLTTIEQEAGERGQDQALNTQRKERGFLLECEVATGEVDDGD